MNNQEDKNLNENFTRQTISEKEGNKGEYFAHIEPVDKIKTVLVADSGFFGPVKLKDCDLPKVIVIEESPVPVKTIEICGIKYVKRKQENPSKLKRGSFLELATLALAFPSYSTYGLGGGAPRKRPAVDLEKEFELIQKKQSNLGRSDRDWVCNQFNYVYKQID